MSETPLAQAKRLLRERTGIAVPDYREPLLRAELGRLGQGELERGLARLRGEGPQLLEDVAGTFAVAETYLFRGPEHYRELRRLAQASLARGLPFYVLCAGVSTGEEAWSAAMVLAEVYEGSKLPYHVRGWELSQERLVRARVGRFGRWSARGGLMDYQRYLIEVEGGYEVAPALRRRVTFEHVNLVDALPETGRVFDVIFFRNVSLYWDRPLASEVAEALGDRLGLRGSLFVGPSDPIELPREGWEAEPALTWRIYRRRSTVRLAPVEQPAAKSTAKLALRSQATQAKAEPSAAATPKPPTPKPPTPNARPIPAAPASSPPAPSNDSSDALIARMRELADSGDHDQALALLAGRDEPHAPELLELAGIIHLGRGDLDAAIASFRAAVYWAPGIPAHARWLELAIQTRAKHEAQPPPPAARLP